MLFHSYSWFYFLAKNLIFLFCFYFFLFWAISNDSSIYAFRVRSGSPKNWACWAQSWPENGFLVLFSIQKLNAFALSNIFPLIFLGPDLLFLKIWVSKLKVGQKTVPYLFYGQKLILFLLLSNDFSINAFRVRYGSPETQVCRTQSGSENRASCLVSVSYLSFVLLLTKEGMFIRDNITLFCL